VILIGAVVVAVATFNAESQNQQLPHFTVPDTVLFQLRSDDSHAVLSAVVADRGRTWFVIPNDTIMDKSDINSTIARIAEGVVPEGAVNAVSLGANVKIDEAWQLDRLGIAALVELVGGVQVTPKSDMLLGATTPNAQMSLSKNVTVQLNGIFAAWYALGEGAQSPSGKVAQFHEVWQQIMQRTDAATLSPVMSSVGASSHSTLSLPELVALFEKWQQINETDGISWVGIKTEYVGSEFGRIRVISALGRQQLLDAGAHERLAS
jgi:anionic cell wall polymer biosynthesis LytR-Cps2A-Psr (LCP) family protein